MKALSLWVTCGLALCFTPAVAMEAAAPQDRRVVLDRVLQLAQERALYASHVDWTDTRHVASQMLQRDDTDAGLSASVRYVLKQLGDRHSSYLPPRPESAAGAERWPASLLPQAAAASMPARTPEPIAVSTSGPANTPFLAVNAWSGRAVPAAATQARAALNDLLARPTCGLILDLSKNHGGNMWPMVAGILPLLSAGPLGAFEYRDGQRAAIISTGNGVLHAGRAHALNDLALPPPQHLPSRIAILLGPRTASSGEITAVLFKGQGNVRFFGKPTAGVPTANSTFPLPNGGMLALTTAVTLDRAGNRYSSALLPDEDTAEPAVAAERWVAEECAAARVVR